MKKRVLSTLLALALCLGLLPTTALAVDGLSIEYVEKEAGFTLSTHHIVFDPVY